MGKKYIIELEDKPFYEGKIVDDFNNMPVGKTVKYEILYRVKGFKSLVFDLEGLKRLQEYKPEAEFSIGDEVMLLDSTLGIIVEKTVDGRATVMNRDGMKIKYSFKNMKRTGEHYDNIEETLAVMEALRRR